MKLFCLVLLLVGSSLVESEILDTFGLSASPAGLTGILDDVVLPIIDDLIYEVGQTVPSQCCYKHVKTPGTRVYLEELTIPKNSIISTGKVTTSDKGIIVDAQVQFNLTFYLHLCESVVGHCQTLLGCKGFSNILFTSDVHTLVDIYPNSLGQPTVELTDFFFNLDAPEKVNLCDFLSVGITTIVEVLSTVIDDIGAQLISKEITAVLQSIPQTIVIGDPLFDIHWAMTNTTGSSDVGTSLMFDLDVLIKTLGDKVGPFTADPAIPNALKVLEGPGALGLDFSDAIINNIIYALFTVKNPAYKTEVEGFDVTATLTTPPVVSFTDKTGLDSASLTLDLKVLLKKSFLRITAHADATAYFELLVLPEGLITLQLNPDDLVVVITSTVPPVTNETKNLIIHEIENAWEALVPEINAVLMAKALPLPHVADFNNPYIEYGTGYAAVGFDTAHPGNEKSDLIERLTKAFFNPIGEIVGEQVMGPDAREKSCPSLASFGAEPVECEPLNATRTA